MPVQPLIAGRKDEAGTEVSSRFADSLDVRCENVLAITPLRDKQAAARYRELLKAAGLPE